MELGPGSLSSLFLHVVAAEVNGKRDVREVPADMLRGDPVCGIVGMIVVTVHAHTGGVHEVGIGTIAIPVGNAHIIMADGPAQERFIRDDRFVQVATVTGNARTVCKKQLDFRHQ